MKNILIHKEFILFYRDEAKKFKTYIFVKIKTLLIFQVLNFWILHCKKY